MTLSREQIVGGAIILADLDWAKSGLSREQVLGAAAIEAMGEPAVVVTLARIQAAIAKHVRENPTLTKDQFIQEVLAAADDKEVVRAVRKASGASPER